MILKYVNYININNDYCNSAEFITRWSDNSG